MARYIFSCIFPFSLDKSRALIKEITTACQLEIEFQTDDYLMAKETIKKIAFDKLVKVDIILNNNTSKKNETNVEFIIKNEELAFNNKNRAMEKFKQLKQIITANYKLDIM